MLLFKNPRKGVELETVLFRCLLQALHFPSRVFNFWSMMPNRFIKESIWTSPTLNALSEMALLHFLVLLPLPDDHGCFESSSNVVKGRCYPLRAKITASMIQKWQDELENVGLIRRWTADGREFAIFLTFSKHQRIRSLHIRKTPPPPSFDDKCRHLTTNDRLIPIPIPIPKRLNITADAEFNQFYSEYPKKVGKAAAFKAWGKLDLSNGLFEKIMSGLRSAKGTSEFHKSNMKYIPHPGSWLNGRRWEDEYTKENELIAI